VKIGYARVSTQDQKLDLQLRSLKKVGCQKIFREKVSGFNRQRPEFKLFAEGKAVRDVARTFKVHEATIYRMAAAL
jgi:predicted site-specific integrase-resolvase